MFVTRESRVLSDFVQPMTSTCANIILRQALKAKKDKKLSALESSRNISRVHSKPSETITIVRYQITFSSTEMESETP